MKETIFFLQPFCDPDVTVEQINYSLNCQCPIFDIQSCENQNDDIFYTKLSFKDDKFIFTNRYKNADNKNCEYIPEKIFESKFMEFHQHLQLLQGNRSLL